MAKYKLTVKYKDVCELTLEGAQKEVISNEIDNYIQAFLNKKGCFRTNFNNAVNSTLVKITDKAAEDAVNSVDIENIVKADEAVLEITDEKNVEIPIEHAAEIPTEPVKEAVQEPVVCKVCHTEEPKNNACYETASHPDELTLRDYAKNKNINTTLDEFVTGACYLDEILDIKEFTLKQINSKLYPVFRRLADLGVIEHAKERVLITSKEINGATYYSINQNAWNYHNYDLVRH